jgi:hypothetical protein
MIPCRPSSPARSVRSYQSERPVIVVVVVVSVSVSVVIIGVTSTPLLYRATRAAFVSFVCAGVAVRVGGREGGGGGFQPNNFVCVYLHQLYKHLLLPTPAYIYVIPVECPSATRPKSRSGLPC